MAYNTMAFLLIFLPAALAAYQLTPERYRKVTLLAASWLYFWLMSGNLLGYLLLTTGAVYGTARLMNAPAVRKKEEDGLHLRALILGAGLVFVLGLLFYLKYDSFVISTLNRLLAWGGSSVSLTVPQILAPVGISYYTLEAVGYLLEVYWKRIAEEKDFVRLALFLSFFPQTLEGPIARYTDTAQQLTEGKPLTAQDLESGALRILWGLGKKMIIADRLAMIVKPIFGHYREYQGVMILIGALAYTMQLYMEFSGVIDIVIGTAKMFHVRLPENFRLPFLAHNASEFWRRWHISLGTWFKNYIFFPVSTSAGVKRWNRFAGKKFGRNTARITVSAMALFPVWLANGVWHGPQWNYIFYGLYYFVIILAEVILEPLNRKIEHSCQRIGQTRSMAAGSALRMTWNGFRIVKNWVVILVGEMFFRAASLGAGMHMFRSIFAGAEVQKLTDGTIQGFGFSRADFLAVICGTIVVFLTELVFDRKKLDEEWILRIRTPLRWCVFYSLFFTVSVFGAYGTGYQPVDLIYAGF